MTKLSIPGIGDVEDCEVIVDESKHTKIVLTESGERVCITTDLPDVGKGRKGKLIRSGDSVTFVREPYAD